MIKAQLNNRYFSLTLGLILALAFYIGLLAIGVPEKAAITAAVTALTVTWWVSEALPIPATSLVPFALLPLFGVVEHKNVASALGSHVILLLMGAFMLSKALEKSKVHERLAIYMINLVGLSSGKRLVFAFMLTSACLSMWISNTATTLIMLPIALAILKKVDNKAMSCALVLGIAYAASLGGVATPIGTPPNVIFMAIYEESIGKEFSFLSWMKIGVPVVLISLPLMALWLTRNIKTSLDLTLPKLTPWRTDEKRVLIVFGLTALAWITRQEPFGGWTGLLDLKGVGDSTIALTSVVVMFIVSDGKKGRLLDWDTAVSIPWGMLLLFAGGIAIAKGFVASGLSTMLGDWLASMATLSTLVMILIICLVVTYLTEITSNTATATLLLPILAATAIAVEQDPLLFMIPATICASCAFMLPVATAPNAIAYGTGTVEIKDMVKEGFILSLLTVFTTTGVSYLMLS
ncbi:SLC13 family permease [Thalassotalea atypica]|uniref:SLC13 family permease n=1 Tax=Thalassotalea atypica TaxID=2054316 RepID=UPI0025727896|nr:SLC13 family permease [Thalassotalea atypica]